jgi:hypothetical protein
MPSQCEAREAKAQESHRAGFGDDRSPADFDLPRATGVYPRPGLKHSQIEGCRASETPVVEGVPHIKSADRRVCRRTRTGRYVVLRCDCRRSRTSRVLLNHNTYVEQTSDGTRIETVTADGPTPPLIVRLKQVPICAKIVFVDLDWEVLPSRSA